MQSLNPVNKSYCLQEICESNFNKLLRLAPNLYHIDKSAIAMAGGKPELYLKILERNPYTLTLELTHCFDNGSDNHLEPAVKIRVYTDAKSAEVLRDHKHPHVSHALRHITNDRKILDYKWSINYFLEKWLNHCLHLGYCFNTAESVKYVTV